MSQRCKYKINKNIRRASLTGLKKAYTMESLKMMNDNSKRGIVYGLISDGSGTQPALVR